MKKINNNILITFAVILGAVSFYFVILFGQGLAQRGKIPSGVSIAGVNLSGRTKIEAKNILTQKTEEFKKEKVVVAGNKNTEIPASEFELSFEVDKTIDQVMTKKTSLFSSGAKNNHPLQFSYNKAAFYKIISAEDASARESLVNSRIKKTQNGFEIVNGKKVERVNFAESEAQFKESVGNFNNKSSVKFFVVGPTFSQSDFKEVEGRLGTDMFENITLRYGDKAFEIKSEEVFSWIQITSETRHLANQFEKESLLDPIFDRGDQVSIFSEQEIKETLGTRIAKEINQDPVNAQLQVRDGRAAVFVPSRIGKSLNLEKSATEIANALAEGKSEINLLVDERKPEVTEDSINNMGIVELLSTGYSDFKGSPENRKHNIRTGASKFNGVIIKPGDTFSFNTILGPVDASTGYLPELVIVENKTEPQFGGGLCQVSSTAFRAALNAGLPIIERKAHAYPVVYYKPFGVDASIYLPKPDLVFKNDTGKHILVQTRLEGTRLVFDFYGTKPKRTVKFAGNENGAGATDIVEKVNPLIYDQGARGNGSFTAAFWRFVYNESGQLENTKNFVSKYDSPDKYPH